MFGKDSYYFLQFLLLPFGLSTSFQFSLILLHFLSILLQSFPNIFRTSYYLCYLCFLFSSFSFFYPFLFIMRYCFCSLFPYFPIVHFILWIELNWIDLNWIELNPKNLILISIFCRITPRYSLLPSFLFVNRFPLAHCLMYLLCYVNFSVLSLPFLSSCSYKLRLASFLITPLSFLLSIFPILDCFILPVSFHYSPVYFYYQ